jgi:hypothetical protein
MLKVNRVSVLGRYSDEDVRAVEAMSIKELRSEIQFMRRFLQDTVSRSDVKWLWALEEELAEREAVLSKIKFHRKGYTNGTKN